MTLYYAKPNFAKMESVRIVPARAALIDCDADALMSIMERAGKASHAAEVLPEDAPPEERRAASERFIKTIVRLGHESVLEHASVSVFVECSRACSHQWVRHRIAAYTQLSQRFVDHGMPGTTTTKRHVDLTFIDPMFPDSTTGKRWAFGDPDAPGLVKLLQEDFYRVVNECGRVYDGLRYAGLNAEDARAVLPNATYTQFYTTANLRQWRHFFNMRCAPDAQYEIRTLACSLLEQMNAKFPAVFSDLVTKLLNPV